MARYDVYRYADNHDLLLLDVQTDIISDLKTRVVVPLLPKAQKQEKDETIPKLRPVFKILERDYVMITTEISALSISELGECVENLGEDHAFDITDALDFLFQGF